MKRGITMFCKNCGSELNENFTFCEKCGMPVAEDSSAENGPGNENKTAADNAATVQTQGQQAHYRNAQPYTSPQPQAQQMYGGYSYQAPIQNNFQPVTTISQYAAWMLITAIPIVGIIIAIIFAIDSSNMNRANFFRAQIVVIILIALLVLAFWSVIASLLSQLLWL